jgi:DNA transposition AAA+ family ATPase
MPRLIENMRGNRGEFAQLYSRVGGYLKLGVMSLDDASKIISVYIPDAAHLVKVFFNTSRHNARTMAKLVYRTMRAAEIEQCSIDENLIAKTYTMLVV